MPPKYWQQCLMPVQVALCIVTKYLTSLSTHPFMVNRTKGDEGRNKLTIKSIHLEGVLNISAY